MTLPLCRHCRCPFQPDPRIGEAQKVCSRAVCQRARRRAALRLWRVLHPENVRIHAKRGHAWAEANPDYWRRYRQEHPAYYQQDLFRRRGAYWRGRSSAKETLIADVSRRKLAALEALLPPNLSANETSIDRRVELVVDYLVWKARSAKEVSMEVTSPGSG